MQEFDLIKYYFNNALNTEYSDNQIVLSIGDDAACIEIPSNQQIVISTDTLVADVHFFQHWDPYHIAYKAVMVNISDIAAMAAMPRWVSLALTMPNYNKNWLQRFAAGLFAALKKYNLILIGGDTTRGHLTITITIHGLVTKNCFITRSGARPGDKIFVSGNLGAAALAVKLLDEIQEDILLNDSTLNIDHEDFLMLFNKLQYPQPRTDLQIILQKYASALIDISDGLSADLNHICTASNVGACLNVTSLPIHDLVTKYNAPQSLHLVLTGGDDYELCFTVPPVKMQYFQQELHANNILCYEIGIIEDTLGLRLLNDDNVRSNYTPQGYVHFPT